MGDALANYQVILFVYGNADSVTAKIKRDWGSTALQTQYLQLELVCLLAIRKVLLENAWYIQPSTFVFNVL